MDVLVLFGLLLILMSLSVPIGIALGIATSVVILFMSNLNIMLLPQNCFTSLDSFPLMAIPFFILAGNLMKSGGIADRLLKFINSFVGAVTGGLAMVTTMACMFFAALSGSANATVSGIGTFMIPAMREKGYDEGYATAITAAAGSLGVIIPPSISFVVYGVVANVSIGKLFLAGVLPGIVIGVCLMITNYVISKKEGYVGEDKSFSIKETLIAFKEAFWALLTPIIILGGIYGGIFTPTEAAVVGVVYAIFVGIVIYRELKLSEIYEALRDTAVVLGSTIFTLGLSMSFAYFLALQQVPATIGAAFTSISSNAIVTFLLINVMLLFVGCFIDNFSATIILTPIFLPIVQSLGMDPIHFGIVMCVNLAIGFVTPPYGVNLFVASAVADVPIEKTSKSVMPLIATMIVALLIITFVPSLSMYIPSLAN